MAYDQKCVKHDKLPRCVKREVKIEGNSEFKYDAHAAIHIPFDGRSGVSTECREKHCYSKRIGQGH